MRYKDSGMRPAGPSQGWEAAVRIGCLLALLVTPAGPCNSNSRAEGVPRDQSGSAPTNGKAQSAQESHTTKLKLAVVGSDGKPVGNASVYVRFYQAGGFLHHEKLAELDLKTNQDGTVKVPEIPQGKILVQVIAKGWHTFGKWYDVQKGKESIQITLEPPPHWY